MDTEANNITRYTKVYARPDLEMYNDTIHRYAHYYTAGIENPEHIYATEDVIDDAGNRGLSLDIDQGWSKVFVTGSWKAIEPRP